MDRILELACGRTMDRGPSGPWTASWPGAWTMDRLWRSISIPGPQSQNISAIRLMLYVQKVLSHLDARFSYKVIKAWCKVDSVDTNS